MKALYNTEEEVRGAFWQAHEELLTSSRIWSDAYNKWQEGTKQNGLHTDVRSAFVCYTDYLARCGEISEELADEVTL